MKKEQREQNRKDLKLNEQEQINGGMLPVVSDDDHEYGNSGSGSTGGW